MRRLDIMIRIGIWLWYNGYVLGEELFQRWFEIFYFITISNEAYHIITDSVSERR